MTPEQFEQLIKLLGKPGPEILTSSSVLVIVVYLLWAKLMDNRRAKNGGNELTLKLDAETKLALTQVVNRANQSAGILMDIKLDQDVIRDNTGKLVEQGHRRGP